LLATSAFAFGALAQNNIPGQIADPSTYKGSMALQEQERADSAAQQQANDAMLKRLDQNYAAYSPQRGGGGGGAGVPPLKQKPLLPAAKNPLLGQMWRIGPTKHYDTGILGQLAPGIDDFVDEGLQGACAEFLGDPDTVLRFTPTELHEVSPDGRDKVLHKVEYRGDSGNVIVIPTDGGDMGMIYGMTDRDHAVAAFFGCTMHRTASYARLGPPSKAEQAAVDGKAVLSLTLTAVVNGKTVAPPAGTVVFLTNQNPDANLTRAGFSGPQQLFAACKYNHGGDINVCSRGLVALRSGIVGQVQTDEHGKGQSAGVPAGHYFLVGLIVYQGHFLLWHLPVDLKVGGNSVSLTPQDGDISKD
jgi:hypothetical protein